MNPNNSTVEKPTNTTEPKFTGEGRKLGKSRKQIHNELFDRIRNVYRYHDENPTKAALSEYISSFLSDQKKYEPEIVALLPLLRQRGMEAYTYDHRIILAADPVAAGKKLEEIRSRGGTPIFKWVDAPEVQTMESSEITGLLQSERAEDPNVVYLGSQSTADQFTPQDKSERVFGYWSLLVDHQFQMMASGEVAKDLDQGFRATHVHDSASHAGFVKMVKKHLSKMSRQYRETGLQFHFTSPSNKIKHAKAEAHNHHDWVVSEKDIQEFIANPEDKIKAYRMKIVGQISHHMINKQSEEPALRQRAAFERKFAGQNPINELEAEIASAREGAGDVENVASLKIKQKIKSIRGKQDAALDREVLNAEKALYAENQWLHKEHELHASRVVYDYADSIALRLRALENSDVKKAAKNLMQVRRQFAEFMTPGFDQSSVDYDEEKLKESVKACEKTYKAACEKALDVENIDAFRFPMSDFDVALHAVQGEESDRANLATKIRASANQMLMDHEGIDGAEKVLQEAKNALNEQLKLVPFAKRMKWPFTKRADLKKDEVYQTVKVYYDSVALLKCELAKDKETLDSTKEGYLSLCKEWMEADVKAARAEFKKINKQQVRLTKLLKVQEELVAVDALEAQLSDNTVDEKVKRKLAEDALVQMRIMDLERASKIKQTYVPIVPGQGKERGDYSLTRHRGDAKFDTFYRQRFVGYEIESTDQSLDQLKEKMPQKRKRRKLSFKSIKAMLSFSKEGEAVKPVVDMTSLQSDKPGRITLHQLDRNNPYSDWEFMVVKNDGSVTATGRLAHDQVVFDAEGKLNYAYTCDQVAYQIEKDISSKRKRRIEKGSKIMRYFVGMGEGTSGATLSAAVGITFGLIFLSGLVTNTFLCGMFVALMGKSLLAHTDVLKRLFLNKRGDKLSKPKKFAVFGGLAGTISVGLCYGFLSFNSFFNALMPNVGVSICGFLASKIAMGLAVIGIHASAAAIAPILGAMYVLLIAVPTTFCMASLLFDSWKEFTSEASWKKIRNWMNRYFNFHKAFAARSGTGMIMNLVNVVLAVLMLVISPVVFVAAMSAMFGGNIFNVLKTTFKLSPALANKISIFVTFLAQFVAFFLAIRCFVQIRDMVANLIKDIIDFFRHPEYREQALGSIGALLSFKGIRLFATDKDFRRRVGRDVGKGLMAIIKSPYFLATQISLLITGFFLAATFYNGSGQAVGASGVQAYPGLHFLADAFHRLANFLSVDKMVQFFAGISFGTGFIYSCVPNWRSISEVRQRVQAFLSRLIEKFTVKESAGTARVAIETRLGTTDDLEDSASEAETTVAQVSVDQTLERFAKQVVYAKAGQEGKVSTGDIHGFFNVRKNPEFQPVNLESSQQGPASAA